MSKLNQLRVLRINGNRIERLPRDIGNCHALEEIRAGELSNIDPYSKVNEDGEALMPYIWTASPDPATHACPFDIVEGGLCCTSDWLSSAVAGFALVLCPGHID